jgi:outer membrane lipoprotein-sorting protein
MKRIHILYAALSLFALPLAAQNAADILEKAAAAYRNSKGISASFYIRTQSGSSVENAEGVINMKDDKFTIATPGIMTWYDGTTQWVYLEQANEVNLSSPEGDELRMTNPAVLIRDYRKGFTAVYKGEATGSGARMVHHVELTPTGKSDIAAIELHLDKATSLPSYIRMNMKNGTYSAIRISNLQTGVSRPNDFFAFPQSKYPNAEIIDLR